MLSDWSDLFNHAKSPWRRLRREVLACAVAALALLAPAEAHAAPLLFYAGDLDLSNNPAGLSNERHTFVPEANVYQNFIVPLGETWHVTSLFSNDLVTPGTSFASADWFIRSGVSSGNAGTLIAGGNSPVTITPTGRPFPGSIEDTFQVGGLSINLAPGTYWMNVTPVGTGSGRSFNSNTFGLNAVGSEITNDQFFNSTFFGDHFTPALFPFPEFSDGVGGSVTPEPNSLTLFLMAIACIVYHGCSKRLRLLRSATAVLQ
ncbi:MAG TPA: hypothetical protein VG125_16875 [Pirellulales bacterium]|jgi:hypothetical protein|nr:hypothetical protein [Pirellulales bacterium]